MKPTVVINSIGSKGILNDAEYEYILNHTNEPLPLCTVWFDDTGRMAYLSVHIGKALITLFDRNHVKGEFDNGIKFQLG